LGTGCSIGEPADSKLPDEIRVDTRVFRAFRMNKSIPVLGPCTLRPRKQNGRFSRGGRDPGPPFPFIRMLVRIERAHGNIFVINDALVEQEDRLLKMGIRRCGSAVSSIQGL